MHSHVCAGAVSRVSSLLFPQRSLIACRVTGAKTSSSGHHLCLGCHGSRESWPYLQTGGGTPAINCGDALREITQAQVGRTDRRQRRWTAGIKDCLYTPGKAGYMILALHTDNYFLSFIFYLLIENCVRIKVTLYKNINKRDTRNVQRNHQCPGNICFN